MDVGLWTLLDLVDLLGPITAHKTNEIGVFFLRTCFCGSEDERMKTLAARMRCRCDFTFFLRTQTLTSMNLDMDALSKVSF